MAADTFLVIGKNEVIGEGKFPEDQKGRANVLWHGQRVKLHEYRGLYYVVDYYLDDDQIERVLGPRVGK